MRSIVRHGQIVPDEWRHLAEAPADAAVPLIVPWASWRQEPAAWLARSGPLGVRLAPADAVEELAPHLPRLALVAAEFPGPSEGRGYTQGRLLRERYRFAGELRAVGAKQDQAFFLARCGFDAIEPAPGEDLEAVRRALGRFSVAYQPAAADAAVQRKRFRYGGAG